ncbi:MAG: glycosyltransferase family 2 protein [Candidatus Kerfeldbacteria bacterium]|nr:glycosyltransferase family 2 protein [Candidatus Kerfeldbacteria bacterium]
MLDVSIVIVNYNARGLLRQCLKSIFDNLTLPRDKATVVVIDNNSNDDSVAMVREQFPEARLIPLEHNGGYAKAVNFGIRSVESRYYLILNMDTTLVQPRTIERMVEFMDTHPKVGLAGPKLINPNGTTQASSCMFPKFVYPLYRRTFLGSFSFAKKAISRYLMLDWDHNETRAVDWVIGTGMIVRHEALQHVGLMDERFFMYFEDVDWCRRFWESDWHVMYIHLIEVVHYHGRGSAKQHGLISIMLNRQTRVHIISWLKYVWKYLGKQQIHGKTAT